MKAIKTKELIEKLQKFKDDKITINELENMCNLDAFYDRYSNHELEFFDKNGSIV